jgi:hypothetical protein
MAPLYEQLHSRTFVAPVQMQRASCVVDGGLRRHGRRLNRPFHAVCRTLRHYQDPWNPLARLTPVRTDRDSTVRSFARRSASPYEIVLSNVVAAPAGALLM